MVAAVILNKTKHKIFKVFPCEKLCIISIGKKVGFGRLSRVLRPFGNDFICAKSIPYTTSGFDTKPYRKKLLFDAFYKYVMAKSGIDMKVGIKVESYEMLTDCISLVAHAAETVIFSDLKLDDFCRECIKQVGICPDVTKDLRYLLSCDIIFAPDEAISSSGVIFDNNTPLEPPKSKLPDYCKSAVAGGIEPVDLQALLSLEENIPAV